MRNFVFSYLLLPLFTSLSFSLSAAPGTVNTPPGMVNTEIAQPVRLNVNTADAESLQGYLVGIGKAKAEAIVAYRAEHGVFTSVDELLEIKGIGNTLLDRNRDKLTVE